MHIRPFEIAFIGFFAIAAIGGLIYLSKFHDTKSEEEKVYGDSLVIWGTLEKSVFDRVLLELGSENKPLEVVSYQEFDERTFESDLVNAIAEGRTPDLVIIPQSLIVSQRAKLKVIPFEQYPVRTFRDTYIDGAEVFMLSDGIYGIPFAVDPLVLYWNRDLLASGGIATPPKTWENFVSQTVKAVTRTNDRREIVQSAVALGEYQNIRHAKDILAMLFLQAGSSMIEEQNGTYKVTLNVSKANSLNTGDAVLSFYTQFALPTRDLYSWNRSKSLDRTEFLGGTLALYFGKGSEYTALARENPNLNFDLATVPQGSGATVLRNYGDFYAFAIPRATRNAAFAYRLAQDLGSGAVSAELAQAFGFAPVVRSVLAEGTSDPVQSVLYQAGLIARAWLDPDPRETDRLFKDMVEEIVSNNSARTGSIVNDTMYQLEQLF